MLVLVLDLGRPDGAFAGLPKHSISLRPIKPCKASSTARETDLEDDDDTRDRPGQTPIRGSAHEPIKVKGCRPFGLFSYLGTDPNGAKISHI
jgi:hypothetical protein